MERVKKLIHLDYAYKIGLTGKNITIATMDTGIAPHPDFDSRILTFVDFVNKKSGLYDDNGHGTHVAGIMGANGSYSKQRCYQGIAPKVNLVVIKVLDQKGNGNTANVLAGVDWLLKNKEKYQVRLLNISVGMLKNAREKEKQELLDAVEEVWSEKIFVASAAGNNGPFANSVTIPGISRKVLTVGCMDDYGDETGMYTGKEGYSGIGPTDCCIVKPEILAPGTNVISCHADGKTYSKKSGTSMATPVVTGALALAFEKFPELTPAEMKLRLYESAFPRGEYFGKKCWGMIHVDNLIRYPVY